MYSYIFFKTVEEDIFLPRGIQGALKIIKADGLSVVVEPDLCLDEIKKSDDMLLKAVVNHDRIIRELFAQITVLPLRFGTYFLSEENLLSYLKEQATEYLQKLTFLTNKGEYTLRLNPRELEAGNNTQENLKGRAYFLAKKQRYQLQLEHQSQQNQELTNILNKLEEYRINYHFPAEQREKIYLLLNDTEFLLINDLLRELATNLNTWDLNLGEKLPPYHFT